VQAIKIVSMILRHLFMFVFNRVCMNLLESEIKLQMWLAKCPNFFIYENPKPDFMEMRSCRVQLIAMQMTGTNTP
jgi:hypothetical protein